MIASEPVPQYVRREDLVPWSCERAGKGSVPSPLPAPSMEAHCALEELAKPDLEKLARGFSRMGKGRGKNTGHKPLGSAL